MSLTRHCINQLLPRKCCVTNHPNNQWLETAILHPQGSAGRPGSAALGLAGLRHSCGMGWASGHLGWGHWGGPALCHMLPILLLRLAVSLAWCFHGNRRDTETKQNTRGAGSDLGCCHLLFILVARGGPAALVRRRESPVVCGAETMQNWAQGGARLPG